MRVLDEKQPYEEYYITFDFLNAINTAVISSADISVIDSAGVDVTHLMIGLTNPSASPSASPSSGSFPKSNVPSTDIVNAHVHVPIRGGVSGEKYTITCKIITEAYERYELEAQLPVIEITKY